MASTAVVTGGSAGIGLATADRLAAAGWNVAIVARDPARLEEARAMLLRRGGRVLSVSADVAEPEAVEEAAARAEAELGPIGAWVNNAMSTVVSPAERITPAEYQRVTATTYLSQVYGTLAALRRMRPRRRGVIVQISSGIGIRAAPLQAAYCAAKFAVTGFTDSLRAELIAEKLPIDLSVVYLPAVNTPQPSWSRTHTGREQVIPDPLFDPRLCAEAILSTIERPQREIWVGRTTVMMAAAQAIAPELADHQVSGFADSQLGDPMPDRAGNLYEPVPGPARIDGASTDRVKPTRSEYFTTTQARLAKIAGAGGLLGLGALLGYGLGRGGPRLPR